MSSTATADVPSTPPSTAETPTATPLPVEDLESARAATGHRSAPAANPGATSEPPPPAQLPGRGGPLPTASRTIYPSAEFQIEASPEEVVEPRKPDVLLGRGRPFHVHPGNRRLHDIVDQFKPVYTQSQRLEKNAIVVQVMKMVHDGGGRFLGRNAQKRWTQVSSGVAHKKVSHLLRERPHKAQQAKIIAGMARMPVGPPPPGFGAPPAAAPAMPMPTHHAYSPATSPPPPPPPPPQERIRLSKSEAEAATSLLSFAKPEPTSIKEEESNGDPYDLSSVQPTMV